jgi:murein DD-endopeptidase MepM/ murein hydrolase activator NlpD
MAAIVQFRRIGVLTCTALAKRSLGRRTSLAASLAIVVWSSATGAVAPLPSPERASAFMPDRTQRLISGPRELFPMRAEPGYGDGLDAGRGHEGQDLFAPAGTPLVAVADSIVIEVGSDGGRGNYVSIYDPASKRTYNYFHMLAAALVRGGQRVRAGTKLGELGCTGSCWGDHLHFEVRDGRDPYGPVLDPVPVLRRLDRLSTAA